MDDRTVNPILQTQSTLAFDFNREEVLKIDACDAVCSTRASAVNGSTLSLESTPMRVKVRPAARIRPNFASEGKRRAALELFEAGKGYKTVAEALGLSVNTVRDWSRAFKKGRFSVKLSANQYRFPTEVHDHVIAVRDLGLSWREVSEATGVCVSTCRAWVLARDCDKH